jgi:hypothetical protein
MFLVARASFLDFVNRVHSHPNQRRTVRPCGARGVARDKEAKMRELNMAELETVEGANLGRLAWKAAKVAGAVLLELLDADEAK